ncbi:MAG: CsbD family protein [Myxococcota bacterium]
MNDDQLTGRWEQLKGRIQAELGKLTDNDLAEVKGQKRLLVGKIQERYGDAKSAALQRLESLLETLNESLA